MNRYFRYRGGCYAVGLRGRLLMNTAQRIESWAGLEFGSAGLGSGLKRRLELLVGLSWAPSKF